MTLWGFPLWLYLFFIIAITAVTWFRVKIGRAHGKLSVALAFLAAFVQIGAFAAVAGGFPNNASFLAKFLVILCSMLVSIALELISERVKAPKNSDGINEFIK